jgi:polyisoprenyl-teichoic acid--peptidoglycan teichoic acid transferase
VVLVAAGLVAISAPGPKLLATAIVPRTLQALLTLNLLILAWRLAALLQAFFDRRFELRPGGLGLGGLAVIVVVTILPHLAGQYVGGVAQSSFARIFDGAVLAARSDEKAPTTAPGPNERINVLLVGLDTGKGRDHALTDSLIVVSVDPVGKSVSMASLPRDLVGVPLGDGRTFDPKLNSLLSYATRHPEAFPKGGIRTLEDAAGALLGIPIHYYATIDLGGFIKMVDAVGGVDVRVTQALDDPRYKDYGVKNGWSVDVGPHHFGGIDALAYARIRKSEGQTDFTRQARQQEILLALRQKVVRGGALLSLPGLIDAVGDTVTTDMPPELLPDLAVLAGEIPSKRIVRVVVRYPLIHPGKPSNPYGAVQVANMDAITAMARALFPPPGGVPVGWTPKDGKPSLAPANPLPSASPGS